MSESTPIERLTWLESEYIRLKEENTELSDALYLALRALADSDDDEQLVAYRAAKAALRKAGAL